MENKSKKKELNYKAAFHIMTGLVLFLLVCLLLVAYVQKKQIRTTEFYADVISTEARTEREKSMNDYFPININTASKIELTLLPGIGDSRAQDIIDYRNEYGRFTVPEDLLKIKGIGESTLENIKPYIIFEDADN